MAEQAVFGHGNIQILVKESADVHIEVSGVKVASLWVPPFRKPLPVGKTRDLSLLLPSTAITELVGREQLWQDCLGWCSVFLCDAGCGVTKHISCCRAVAGETAQLRTKAAPARMEAFPCNLRFAQRWPDYLPRELVKVQRPAFGVLKHPNPIRTLATP